MVSKLALPDCQIIRVRFIVSVSVTDFHVWIAKTNLPEKEIVAINFYVPIEFCQRFDCKPSLDFSDSPNSAIKDLDGTIETSMKALEGMVEIKAAIAAKYDEDVAINIEQQIFKDQIENLVTELQRISEALCRELPNATAFSWHHNLFQFSGCRTVPSFGESPWAPGKRLCSHLLN